MDATARRRWFGAVVLLAALGMLVLGETALNNWLSRLSPVAFLVYWLVCLALTGLAILVAFADARALQLRARNEQKALIEEAFRLDRSKSAGKSNNENR